MFSVPTITSGTIGTRAFRASFSPPVWKSATTSSVTILVI